MDTQNPDSPLAGILKNTVIPWIERDGMANIFMAAPAWHAAMELPEGMTATRKPIRGKRAVARGQRPYGSAAVIDAVWPQDNLHSARTPKLCFILAGPVAFQVSDYVLHCRPGHGILLPPGIPYNTGGSAILDQARQHQGFTHVLQMMPYQGGMICWVTSRKQDNINADNISEGTCSVPHSQAVFYLNQLVDEAGKARAYQRLLCDSLLNITVTLLYRELQLLPTLQIGEIPLSGSRAMRKNDSITQAREYIERNLRESLTIGRVARYVCMSRTAFTAQFRVKTGKTFAQYVQDMRFEEASALLRGGDLSVHHICAAVGIKPNRMRILFRQREGVSPSQYRQRHRPLPGK